MQVIYGNSRSQSEVKTLLPKTGTLALTGPKHLGKASYAKGLIEDIAHPSDVLVMDPGVDGVRDAVEFCRTAPARSDYRILLIDDADALGEPAQDALLKMSEEPHASMRVVLIAHDPGHLQPALRSRLRAQIRWFPLPEAEMRQFASSVSSVIHESLLALSSGLPGVYNMLLSTPGFEDFHKSILAILSGVSQPFMQPVPSILKEIKEKPEVRDGVVHILQHVIGQFPSRSKPILRFCQTLEHVHSANVDIHWQRMSAQFLDVP